MKAQTGHKAPLLQVSDWIQGGPVNLDQLAGRVVLVEIFQVNCPGCFLYSLPQAIDLYRRYFDQGLSVLGVATAFEDFDKNNLENLKRLIDNGDVVGETRRILEQQGKLTAGRWPYRIPFPVAMDCLHKSQAEVTHDEVAIFINDRIPDFEQQPQTYQQKVRQQVQYYLESLTYHAATFELFHLKGTPSHILIDRQGLLRDCVFGAHPDLEALVLDLLHA
jgi:thiol-disulfide isomerase/thioredoxin